MQTTAVILKSAYELALEEVELVDPCQDDAIVEMRWSGVSAGTEKLLWSGEMPWFPGLSYPLVPGYEGVGEVVEAGSASSMRVGDRVFVPGANCYRNVSGLFGAAAARIVSPGRRLIKISKSLGEEAVLLSLAATAHHALTVAAVGAPTLIVGHGVVGRLIARIMVARGDEPPRVWERAPERRQGASGYVALDAALDETKSYATIIDASGDSGMLDTLISRLTRGGEIILAGFYAKPLSFAFPPAFMREARLSIAAEFQPSDLAAVVDLLDGGKLSLEGLISHHANYCEAESAYRTAFTDPACTKMVIDWRHTQ